MKGKRKGRVVALLLTVVLMFGMFSVTALAGDGDYSYARIGSVELNKSGTQILQQGTGTVEWNADTATLTLQNATVSGSVEVVMTDSSRTLTVVLQGSNTITTEFSGIYTNAHLEIKGEAGASLKGTSTSQDYNAIYAVGNLTISGGSFELDSGYPVVCTDGNLRIENGARIQSAVSKNGSAVYAGGSAEIIGQGTVVNATGYWCALLAGNSIRIGEGASFTGHSQNDHVIYTSGGGITLDSANVVLTSDYAKATGLFVDIEDKLSIDGSTLQVTTDSTSLFSQGDIEISDSNITIQSGANPINAWGSLVIDGDDTVMDIDGAYPVSGNTVEIKGGKIDVNTTKGIAISGDDGVAITGGEVSATTSAEAAAIYSEQGNILLDGSGTKVTASSAKDSAIFTRNGTITLNAGGIKAVSADGFAPVVARKSGTDGTGTPENLIIIGENFSPGENMVATTVWKQADDGTYYADTMIVSTDTDLNENGLLDEDYQPENSELNISEKSADYSAVDEAIEKAQSLDKDAYTDFSGVESAIAAVDRTKKISQQSEVDAMAKAIEDAIAALQKKPVIIAGANSVWEKGSKKGLVITSDAAFADFVKVVVNGQDLDETNYEKTEGSTVITLKPTYLNTLSAGKYVIGIVSKNGTAETTFTIKAGEETDKTTGTSQANTTAVKTGDSSHMNLWVILMAATGLVIVCGAGLRIYRRKQGA